MAVPRLTESQRQLLRDVCSDLGLTQQQTATAIARLEQKLARLTRVHEGRTYRWRRHRRQ